MVDETMSSAHGLAILGRRGRLAVWIASSALMVCVLLMTACAPAAPVAAKVLGLENDGLTIEVTTMPITDAPTEGHVNAARAITVARERVQGQEAVASPDARLVRLTTKRQMDGTMLITDRRVWLVSFPGVKFTAAPCACTGDAPPPLTAPTTAIAIDPADGVVVTKIGLS